MQVDETANGQEIELARGQTLEITLAERPTSGFRWQVVADGQPACRATNESLVAPSGGPGGDVTRTFAFETSEPGLGVIEIANRRSWESAAPARTFTLRVRVLPT